MEDLDFVLELIDPWISKFISEGSAALSPLELVGVGIWTLEAEVNNGGLDQYYFNSAGELAIQTVSSLEAIGAPNTASLLAAANSEFPSTTPPADRRLRQEMLEKSETLPDLARSNRSSIATRSILFRDSRATSRATPLMANPAFQRAAFGGRRI